MLFAKGGQPGGDGSGAGPAVEAGVRRMDAGEVQAGGGREEHGPQLRVALQQARQVRRRRKGDDQTHAAK